MSVKSDLPLVIIGLGAAYLIITSITTPAAAIGQAAGEWWDDMFGGAPRPADLADSAYSGWISPTPEGFLPSNITWDIIDPDTGQVIALGLPFGYTPETWCAAFPETPICRIVRGEVSVPYTYTSPPGCEPLDLCIATVGTLWPTEIKNQCPDYAEWVRCDYPLTPDTGSPFGTAYGAFLVGLAQDRVASLGSPPVPPVTSPPPEDAWYDVVWSWLAGLWVGTLEWVTWTNGYE